MSKKYVCDFCGKEINFGNQIEMLINGSLCSPVNETIKDIKDRFDFCANCSKKVVSFLKKNSK